MTFKNKTEYKAFVDQWKADYASLSVAIRTIKYTTRKDQSFQATKKLMKHVAGKTPTGELIFDNVHIQAKYDDLRNRRQLSFGVVTKVADSQKQPRAGFTPSKLATELLKVRAEGKVQAKVQYEQWNETTGTATTENSLTTSTKVVS